MKSSNKTKSKGSSYTEEDNVYLISEEEEEEENVVNPNAATENEEDFCGIRLRTLRSIGFLITGGLGAVFFILGLGLAMAQLPSFAIFFTIGTVSGLISTLFQVGPICQAKALCDSKNIVVSIIKLTSLAVVVVMISLILCSAFWWKMLVAAVIFSIIEFVAVILYSITLVPFVVKYISRLAAAVRNKMCG